MLKIITRNVNHLTFGKLHNAYMIQWKSMFKGTKINKNPAVKEQKKNLLWHSGILKVSGKEGKV